MSEQIQLRLEEVLLLIPCPVAGCWGLHGSPKTAYYFSTSALARSHVLEVWPKTFDAPDDHEGNGDEQADDDLCFGLAEFDFMELIKVVPLENFHFSQMRSIIEIGWKEVVVRTLGATGSPRARRGGRRIVNNRRLAGGSLPRPGRKLRINASSPPMHGEPHPPVGRGDSGKKNSASLVTIRTKKARPQSSPPLLSCPTARLLRWRQSGTGAGPLPCGSGIQARARYAGTSKGMPTSFAGSASRPTARRWHPRAQT